MTHSYVNSVTPLGAATNYSNQKFTSEYQHLKMLNHFADRRSFERFAKTEKEHAKTVTAIRNYTNKNHKPMN